MDDDLEAFWGDLLSEEPIRIRDAWSALDMEEKLAVRDHLRQMASEPGWAVVQREAAQVALLAIEDADAGSSG